MRRVLTALLALLALPAWAQYPLPAGAVPFGNSYRQFATSSADFSWDNTDKQLLVGLTASAAKPAYSFPGTGNDDNGLWRSGTDEISLVTAGVNRITIGPTGTISVTTGSSWPFVRLVGDTMTGHVTSPGFVGPVTGAVRGNVIGNLTGDVTGNVTGNLTGAVTGNVTGNLTGNVTGNLTGNVTGNVTGNTTGAHTGTLSSVTGNIIGSASENIFRTGDTLTGPLFGTTVAVNNGLVGAPSIRFANDTDTGIYLQGANALGVVAGGVESARFKSDGSIIYTPQGNVHAHLLSTTDGADNSGHLIYGGGANGVNRGAGLELYGNESGAPGTAFLTSGNIPGGNVEIQVAGVTKIQVTSATSKMGAGQALGFAGSTSGTLTLTPPAIAGTQTYVLTTAQPAGASNRLTATSGGQLYWENTAKQTYTPTFTGFGTVDPSYFQYYKSGCDIHINGKFVTGSPVASPATFTLPAGVTTSVDATHDRAAVGNLVRVGTGGTIYNIMGVNGANTLRFGAGASGHGDVNGDTLLGSSETVYLQAVVPTTGNSGSCN